MNAMNNRPSVTSRARLLALCTRRPYRRGDGAPVPVHANDATMRPTVLALALALAFALAIAAEPDYVLLERDDVASLVHDDWLHVGSEDALLAGVTHVVVATAAPKQRGSAATLHVPLDDVASQPLAAALALTTPFLAEARRSRGRVLVHCKAGVSRSVALVIGYLIEAEHMTYDAALAAVRTTRPRAQPNAGFERELRALEDAVIEQLAADEV